MADGSLQKDEKGRPWMSVACQGLGASVWYPCKDHQSDEPDSGAVLMMTVPDTFVAVGNGRLINKTSFSPGTMTWKWEVKNPINNYNIIPYIGKYVNFTDTVMGEKGKLDMSYWVLDYNLEKAKKQFKQAKP
jgi:aminopeptidase N